MNKPTIEGIFADSEMKSITGEDLHGKILILNPTLVAPQYQQRKYLLWQARGGFGCHASAAGRAVFATCLGDKEEARWNRSDFMAEFIGTV
jgi:hypothetical protein